MQSKEGFGFGKRWATIVVAAAIAIEGAGSGDGVGGCDRGVGRQTEGGRRGRKRNRLWEMWLQVFLLTSLQA